MGDSENSADVATPEASTPPPAAQTPPQAGTGAMPAGLPAAGTSPAAGTPQPAAQAPVSLVPAPPVQPKRGGLAGFVDSMLDDLAGTTGQPKLRQGSDGNYYIEHPSLSRKGQWLKIAGEAVRGAAAGAAVGRGPGGAERGAEAGVEAGDKMADRQRQQGKDLSEEAKQKNQEIFNAVKLKHDMAAKEFELSRLKVGATQEDIKFSQEQLDREQKLGSADLGVYKDEADLARVKEAHPDFWKSVYQNNIVAVPELNEKGERQGIHVFLRTPGMGSQLAEPGTPIRIWDAGNHVMTEQKPTVPQTHDMIDAYNTAADNKKRQWQIDNSEMGLRASEEKKNLAQAGAVPSEIAERNAQAGKVRAETVAAGSAKRPDGTWDQSSLPVSLVEGNMDPSQLSKRTKDYNANLQAANQYSMEKYGKPFDIGQAQSDYKYATHPQTQNTLKMIRAMADPGGSIEIAGNAAKALPKLPEETINKVFNLGATEFGSPEATNFHTAMLGLADEYSKVMGGGISTDTGRQAALNILKAHYSSGQIDGAIKVMRKDIDARQSALVGGNRYLLKQYGHPPIYATAPGKPRQMSTDGGKTWQPAP
jgi:hypothetical protein